MLHYAILAHKNPKQIEILCQSLLFQDQVKVYIHIDANSDINKFLYLQSEYIEIIPDTIKISWWGFSIIQATLNLFHTIAQNMHQWDHVIIMSGQDFPIKSPIEIIDFLSKHPHTSWVPSIIQPHENWNILNRVEKYHFHDLVINKKINKILEKCISYFVPVQWLRNQIFCYIAQRIVNIFMPRKRFLTTNFVIYRWSQRQILSYEIINYIINFCNTKIGEKFIAAFKTTAWPDEIFFQTIIMNSPHKENIINNTQWYIDWKKWPWLPRILDETDYTAIKQSPYLFARKFELPLSEKLIHLLTISTDHD